MNLLNGFFDCLVSIITDGVVDKINEKMIKDGFLECASFIANFEDESFGNFSNDFDVIFSKENMKELFCKLRKQPSYEYHKFLKDELEKIMYEYSLSEPHFIECFIRMFDQIIERYDAKLSERIFIGDFRDESYRNNTELMVKVNKIYDIVSKDHNIEVIDNGKNTSYDNNKDYCNYEWKLEYNSINGIWGDNDSRIKDIKHLIEKWQLERLAFPGWYIIPYNKRNMLRTYTNCEELLFSTSDIEFEVLFEFAYEIVWRFENSFKVYYKRLIDKITEIWKEAYKNNFFENADDEDVASKWFYIGQVLLRECREDLEISSWKYIYDILIQNADIIKFGQDELNLEKLKMYFMKQRITEAKEFMSSHSVLKNAYSVRLQWASIRAECGNLKESLEDLKTLEKDINDDLAKSEDSHICIHLSSILGCVYFMLLFVYQAINPFDKDDYLCICDKISEYHNFFDFDDEKKTFYQNLHWLIARKEKEVPFELGRETRVLFGGDIDCSDIYDFYRMIDRASIPLHIGNVRLLDEDESDYINGLCRSFSWIGWFTLLRFGSTKTIKKVLTRKFCFEIASNRHDLLDELFLYIYDAVDKNLEAPSTMYIDGGNAYKHSVSNGLEILKRIIFVSSISHQKMMITLMGKLISVDIIKERGYLNEWIRCVMMSLDERIKASELNELLKISTNSRKLYEGDYDLDPFDVFYSKENSKHLYKNAIIDPDTIEILLTDAEKGKEEKNHYISRLGLLYDFNLLNNNQIRRFADLLWSGEDADQIPFSDTYYYSTYLSWPHPDNLNPQKIIKKALLDKQNFAELLNRQFSSISLNENRFLLEIRNINRHIKDFWVLSDIEFLFKGFVEYWKYLSNAYEALEKKSYYTDEYNNRLRSFVFTMASFSRKDVACLQNELKDEIIKMADQIEDYGMPSIEIKALCVEDDDIKSVIDKTVYYLHSAYSKEVDSAVNASEILLKSDIDDNNISEMLNELVNLCRYRKNPGLRHFLIVLHNYLYNNEIIVNDEIYFKLCEMLNYIDEQSDYTQYLNYNETEFKKIIELREACSNLAYQLYVYEEKNGIDHSKEVLNWKNICRESKSLYEFSEVKRSWIE